MINEMTAIAEDLMKDGITLKEINDELDYRDANGIDEDQTHVGWNDILYFYSTNEIFSALEIFEAIPGISEIMN